MNAETSRLFPLVTGATARRCIALHRVIPNVVGDQMHYLIAANRAQMDGFTHLAAALMQLGRGNTLPEAPKVAPAADTYTGSNWRDNG